MKGDCTTNSHYLVYTFLFRKVGRMYFLKLGVQGLYLYVSHLCKKESLVQSYWINSPVYLVIRTTFPKLPWNLPESPTQIHRLASVTGER